MLSDFPGHTVSPEIDMPTIMQQLSYKIDETEAETGLEPSEMLPDPALQQQQSQPSRDREKLQLQLQLQQQRDQRHGQQLQQQRDQLQTINSLLLDLPGPPQSPRTPTPPPAQSGTSQQAFHHRSIYSQPYENGRTHSIDTHFDGDMSISDLFGLGMPRGPLMNGQQTGSARHNNHPFAGRSHVYAQQQYQGQYEEGRNMSASSPSPSSLHDTPSSPCSAPTTPASPGTPGSLYSNPYSTYSSTGTHGSVASPTPSPSPTSRPTFPTFAGNSPTIHAGYYGRPIRGSPSYSDCGSPTLEYPHTNLGCGKSRSNSPADSETSGVSSLDGSMSDIMNCLSLNSSSHGCYSPSLGSLISADLDVCGGGGRNAALQRVQAVKKLLSSSPGGCPGHHHHHHHRAQHSQTRANAAAAAAAAAAVIAGHHYGQGAAGHNAPAAAGFLTSLLGHEKSCCGAGKVPSGINAPEQHISLDRAARFHRNAAALCDATCTWSGVLPPRTQKPDGYSSKVFLGGVPWDITESILIATFKQFGQIRVEWPGKEQSAAQPKGYVYIIFESEKQVRDLLDSCTHDFTNGGSWYYKISSKRMKGKEVQVIPWILNDSNYSKSPSQKLNPDKTVFVGALHGMLTAQGLAQIMNDLFDDVIYAGIDTDKYKYPIGSGRVTFSSKRSYRKAVAAAFIEIKTAKFTKKVQVDPYIEDSMCSGCHVQRGPYFCREEICFRYFCRSCWQWTHAMESMQHHNPMTRDSKTNQMVGLTPALGVAFGTRVPASFAR